MSGVLKPGYVRWDGTKYVTDPTVQIVGPAGPPGPPGPQGPGGIASGPASGDLSGNYPNPTVVRINNATVPSAVTPGNILQVSGINILTYGPLNLAGGSNYVTGLLPTGNQANQSMGGDVSGTTAAATVIKINGATVPVSGGLTTGNVLQVTGASALSYGPLNLAGGSNFVTGVLPIGNQASQTVGGDLSGTTAAATVTRAQGGKVLFDGTTGISTFGGSSTFASVVAGPRVSGTGTAALYMLANAVSPTANNYTLLSSGTDLEVNAPGGSIYIENNTTPFIRFATGSGTPISATGIMRVAKDFSLVARNATNTNDMNLLAADSANNMIIGDSGQTQSTTIYGPTQIIAASAGTIALQSSAGSVYFDAGNVRIRDASHNETITITPADPSIKLDSNTGTFPSIGLIRTKNYGSATSLWEGRNAGGDAIIVQQNGLSLNIGDNNATSGWTLNINGYNPSINARTTFQVFSQASAASVSFANFSGATIDNISFEITATGGANSKIRFGENVIPFLFQNQRALDAATHDLTVAAQAAFTGSTGTNRNGGNLILQSGMFDGGGSAGNIVLQSGTSTVRASINDAGTWTLAPSTTFTTSSGQCIYNASTQAYFGSTSRGIDVDHVTGFVGVRALSGEYMSIGSTIQDLLRIKWVDSGAGSFEFDAGKTSVTIKQNDLVTNSGTGATFTIQAQNETGTTSIGGNLVLKGGTGTSTDGQVQIGTSKSVIAHTGATTFTTRTVSGNLTIDTTTTDCILFVDTSGGVITITLPTPTNGRTLFIKDIKGTFATNNLTLARHASEKIEGTAASYVFSNNWAWARIVSDGTDWYLMM